MFVRLFTGMEDGKALDLQNPVWRVKEIGGLVPARIFVGRLAEFAPNVKISEALAVLIVSLCKSPGECVMWAYTLFRMSQKRDRFITIQEWTEDFPDGIPTDDEMRRIWKLQKSSVPGQDNLLDRKETWV